MKSLVIILVTAAALAAQTAHKKTAEPPEVIPHSAVEPVTADSKPSCPRDDYELKWFIEESTPVSTGWITTNGFSCGGCCNSYCTTSTGTHVVGTLYFKPMCVKKETE
jgi:hypothetical protein